MQMSWRKLSRLLPRVEVILEYTCILNLPCSFWFLNKCYVFWLYDRYLLIFLKFVQAVIPTIEYDYTRQFSMWTVRNWMFVIA
jgi:hypothetical protein